MWSWGNCLLLGVFYASFSLHNEKLFFFLPLGLTHPSFKVCALCTSEHFCSFVCWIGPFVCCGMWEVKRGWVEKFYLLFWHNTAITWHSVRSGWTLVCVFCISSGRRIYFAAQKRLNLRNTVGNIQLLERLEWDLSGPRHILHDISIIMCQCIFTSQQAPNEKQCQK